MVLDNLGSWWKSHLGKKPEKQEQPLKQAQLSVLTELNSLAEVLQWFEQFKLALLPCNVWWQCQTALAEGLTNAVRHAHRNLPQTTPIEIEIKLFSHQMEMRIWDQGQPFDLEKRLHENLALFLPGDPDPHGNGLIFMYKLMDELSYTRTPDQRNCLLMRKNISK